MNSVCVCVCVCVCVYITVLYFVLSLTACMMSIGTHSFFAMPRLTHDQRIQLITLRTEGVSVPALMQRFHISRSAVQRLCKKHREHQLVDDLKRSGRPKISTAREDRCLRRMCVQDPRQVSSNLTQRWHREYGVHATSRTVRNRLLAVGLRGHVAKKKPLLSMKHRAARLQWALERRNWSEAQWQLCFFTDECPIHLIQCHQRRYIRCGKNQRCLPQHSRPTVQAGGGKIMVWGGFSGVGLSALDLVHGNVNTASYLDILEHNLLPLQLPSRCVTFQQDNAPAHKSQRTTNWLHDHGFSVLPWPAQSPDLNPMENVWSYLKHRLDTRIIHTLDELWESVNEEWLNIPLTYLTNLASSMPRRLEAVIKARGAHTQY
jgi:transposase